MPRTLGILIAASLLVLGGCGSSSSTATDPDPAGSPSRGPGPVPGAHVLPLISMTGGGGRVSAPATLLGTEAQVARFTREFRARALAGRVAAAAARARKSGYLVFGQVVALGCDRPPGATVSVDADGDVLITPMEVESPLPECLAPVTTVAIATVPGSD